MNKWLAFLLLGIALLAGATGLALAQSAAANSMGQPAAMPGRLAQPLGVNVALEQYQPAN